MVPVDLELQDVGRVLLGLVGRVGELHAAGLHAPAGEHLGLDDGRAADALGDLPGLGGVGREAVVGDGDARALDDRRAPRIRRVSCGPGPYPLRFGPGLPISGEDATLLAPIGLLAAVAALATAGPSHAQAPAAPAFCFGFDLLGGDAAELLEGTSGPDHVAGFGADDDIHTYGGEDCASGGAGDDHLRLGPADDDGFGRSGDDLLEGGPGRDALVAGPGADTLRGDEDADLLRDEPGDRDRDVLDGGAGDDVLRAGAGGDVLAGGTGDDVLHAANGAPTPSTAVRAPPTAPSSTPWTR
jgi:hypothetical protein